MSALFCSSNSWDTALSTNCISILRPEEFQMLSFDPRDRLEPNHCGYLPRPFDCISHQFFPNLLKLQIHGIGVARLDEYFLARTFWEWNGLGRMLWTWSSLSILDVVVVSRGLERASSPIPAPIMDEGGLVCWTANIANTKYEIRGWWFFCFWDQLLVGLVLRVRDEVKESDVQGWAIAYW